MSAAEKLDMQNSEEHEQMTANDLLGTIGEMNESLDTMKEIIQGANFIALNASIEAARTQTQSENFSLVADQVRRQGERTEELADALGNEVLALQGYAQAAMAVNCTDIANDVIDKIDRNLFERNCDMQAWAQFNENVECVKSLKGVDQKGLKKIVTDFRAGNFEDEKTTAVKYACDRLKILADTYNVYVDLLLINNQGLVVATAYQHQLIGASLAKKNYVKQVFKTGETAVTDMFMDELLDTYTVAYNAPVVDDNDQVIGLISTRFNWEYVQDMVDKMPLFESARLSILSKEGNVLCNRDKIGVLIDNLAWLEAGRESLAKKSGFSIECERNGRHFAWGYCHTFGFNAYAGKEWSAVVGIPIDLKENAFVSQEISRDANEKKQASSNANRALQKIAAKIQERVKSINNINNETNMLAVNAAIQAGVAGAEGEAFSVIASEIGKLARQSEDFVHNINKLTRSLEECVRNTVYTRLGEAAFDTIDKIDRNLYERYCDVQAFATFEEFTNYEKKDIKVAFELLRSLHEIYEVYHDIFLLDVDGNIIASAIHKEVIGQNQADRDWFREALSGSIVVTDFYFSNSINAYTVTYAAPVKNEEGRIIAVATTRFNCDVMYDIMKATIVGNECDVILINSKGFVIGHPKDEGILEASTSHLNAFKQLDRNEYGYTLEKDPSENNDEFAIGYAKTQGYINYKGSLVR